MFIMVFKMIHERAMVGCSSSTDWHAKLAHQNIQQVKSILSRSNIKYSEGEEETCVPCLLGKQHKLPFQVSNTRGERPCELLHLDIVLIICCLNFLKES